MVRNQACNLHVATMSPMHFFCTRTIQQQLVGLQGDTLNPKDSGLTSPYNAECETRKPGAQNYAEGSLGWGLVCGAGAELQVWRFKVRALGFRVFEVFEVGTLFASVAGAVGSALGA